MMTLNTPKSKKAKIALKYFSLMLSFVLVFGSLTFSDAKPYAAATVGDGTTYDKAILISQESTDVVIGGMNSNVHWYKFTPAYSGTYGISFSASGSDTSYFISLYTYDYIDYLKPALAVGQNADGPQGNFAYNKTSGYLCSDSISPYLKAGTAYLIYIMNYNNSSLNSTLTIGQYCMTNAVESPVSNLSVNNVTMTTANLSWDVPSNPNCRTNTVWQLASNGGTWQKSTTSSLTSTGATVTGLLPGTSYTFRVNTSYDDGGGVDSYTANCTTTAAGKPTISVDSNPSTDGLPTWKWTSGGGDGHYSIYLNRTDIASNCISSDTTATSYKPATPLKNFSNNILYVKEEQFPVGSGVWSPYVSCNVSVQLSGQPPIVTSATRTTSSKTPTWTWSSKDGSTQFRYKLNSSSFTGSETATTATSYTPNSNLPDGDYTLYVEESGYGTWSSAGSYTITINTSTPIVTTYTAAFNSEGGSPVTSLAGLSLGAKVTKPADPTRNGFSFGGWYKDEACNTAWDFANDTVTEDTTIYAKWTAIPVTTYTVTFQDWDGTILKTQTVNDGDTATAPTNPTRTDYSFTGWDVAYDHITSDLTVTAQYSSNTSGGGSTTPTKTDVTVSGTTTTTSDGTPAYAATITPSQADTSTVNNAVVNLGNVSVTIPSSVASSALGDGTGLTLSQGFAPETTQAEAQDAAAKGNGTAVAVISIDLTRTTSTGTEAVHQLSGAVTVTITLTPEQIATIRSSSNPHIYYYDPVTGALTDMNATFDLTAGTATFTTTHFSNYVLATASKTPPTVSGVSNNSVYNTDKTITFDKGTATLDGAVFTNGSTVRTEGQHTLIVTDAVGNSTTVVFTIDKTAPIVTGITSGGFYTSNKTITFNEGTATLDGNAFTSGDTVSKEGKHTLTVTDVSGNKTTIAFTIYKTAPVISMKTGNKKVKNGAFSSGAVTVRASDTLRITKTVTRNGKTITWPKNGVFTKDGTYIVTAKNQKGLITKSTFTVDTKAPKITAKRVKGKVTIKVTETNLSTKTVTKNGKKYVWPNSGKFTAKGKYTITATDKAGHKTKYTFKI